MSIVAMMKCGLFLGILLPVLSALAGENLLRNGSFEFDNVWNGMKTNIRADDLCGFQLAGQSWTDLGLEGWWGDGVQDRGLFKLTGLSCSGGRALTVSAPGRLRSENVIELPEALSTNGFSLSFMVRTTADVKASVTLEATDMGYIYRIARFDAVRRDIPMSTGGYIRVSCTLPLAEPALSHRQPIGVCARFEVNAGAITVDDVQIEQGHATGRFSVPRSHWFSVSGEGFSTAEMPTYRADGKTETSVVISNASERVLNGDLVVWMGPWDEPYAKRLGEAHLDAWKPGEVKKFPFGPGKLAPGAYVVLAELPGKIGTDGTFDPVRTGGGGIGRSMISARNGMRFAVFSAEPYARLFGVGNGMINVGTHWSGIPLSNTLEARELKPVLLGVADSFHAAMVGAPWVKELSIDYRREAPESIANPSARDYINIFSPEGRAYMDLRAEKTGKECARDQGLAAATLAGECIYFSRASFNQSKDADRSFARWAQVRFNGDLKELNQTWKTSFTSWDGVVQPISSVHDGNRAKTGAAAVDWLASMGRMTPESKKVLQENPEWSMDWFRWRSSATRWMFRRFLRIARKYDQKTLYGNNYAWPEFFMHIILPLWREHDALFLDMQYIGGMPRDLGTSEEMLDILEMAESIAGGKPVIGREIYVQPQFPPEMAVLQHWAMVAHGMNVPMTFAWKPYSDHGVQVFKDGPGAWLKPDAPPMWMLIDTDGTRLPSFETVRRSAREIESYHRLYDGNSVERIPGDTAIYLSTETSEYNMFITCDEPYKSRTQRDRSAIAAGLRLRGARIEYFDDATLAQVDPKRFRTLIVTPSPMVSPKAVDLIRDFAEKGGESVVFGPFDTVDPWAREKKPVALGGRIRLVTDFPGKYDRHPHDAPELNAWWDRFLAGTKVARHAWWENDLPYETGEEQLPPGVGRPAVEVVIREQKGTHERFVFVLNKGGSGFGRLSGPDFEGAKFVEALNGREHPAAFCIEPFGYRVLKVIK